jgi:hypothetical protein
MDEERVYTPTVNASSPILITEETRIERSCVRTAERFSCPAFCSTGRIPAAEGADENRG